MRTVPAEVLKEYVNSQKFSSCIYRTRSDICTEF